MSKWMMTMAYFTQIKQLCFAFTITLVTLFAFNLVSNNKYLTNPLSNSCLSMQSNQQLNSTSNNCQQDDFTMNSWLSWLSGDSQSTHHHYLDLVELLHSGLH
jgi:hypothetical protein